MRFGQDPRELPHAASAGASVRSRTTTVPSSAWSTSTCSISERISAIPGRGASREARASGLVADGDTDPCGPVRGIDVEVCPPRAVRMLDRVGAGLLAGRRGCRRPPARRRRGSASQRRRRCCTPTSDSGRAGQVVRRSSVSGEPGGDDGDVVRRLLPDHDFEQPRAQAFDVVDLLADRAQAFEPVVDRLAAALDEPVGVEHERAACRESDGLRPVHRGLRRAERHPALQRQVVRRGVAGDK